MEILVDGKFEYEQNSFSNRLILIIKFKLPGKFFRSKYKKILTTTYSVRQGEMTHKEYRELTLRYLQDKDFLEKEVANMVRDYLEMESNRKVKNNFEQQVKVLVETGNFTVKVNLNK